MSECLEGRFRERWFGVDRSICCQDTRLESPASVHGIVLWAGDSGM